MSVDQLVGLTEMAAPTRKVLPAVGDAGGVVVVAVAAAASVREISTPGHVQTPRGVNSRLTALKGVLE